MTICSLVFSGADDFFILVGLSVASLLASIAVFHAPVYSRALHRALHESWFGAWAGWRTAKGQGGSQKCA